MTAPTVWERLTYLMKFERDAKILEILVGGRKSFSQLQKDTGIKYDASLTRSLRRLSSHNLVNGVYDRVPETNEYHFYDITYVGRVILEWYAEIKDIAKEYDVQISPLLKKMEEIPKKD
ncbi:MAG: winged helix-turn-helix transcriptional regulator [Candidatus Thorarchaeota archaeon]|jgi:DNA-binding HxlR family transcriptional regulator